MEEILIGVNWTAVVVGFVASFVMGWLWYSDSLFGKGWREGSRLMAASGSMWPPMFTQLVGTFLFAWVIGVLAVADALMLTILMTLTFAVLMAAGGMFMQRSTYAIATDVGYFILMAVVMILAHAIF